VAVEKLTQQHQRRADLSQTLQSRPSSGVVYKLLVPRLAESHWQSSLTLLPLEPFDLRCTWKWRSRDRHRRAVVSLLSLEDHLAFALFDFVANLQTRGDHHFMQMMLKLPVERHKSVYRFLSCCRCAASGGQNARVEWQREETGVVGLAGE
jgi:hypothetical protein